MAIFIACSVSRTEQISRLTAQVVIPLLCSLFVLRGKGKTDDKVPRTESEKTDGADFVPSYVFLALPSLVRSDSSA